MKNSISKSNERKSLKPYHKKHKTKLSKEIYNIDNFSSGLSTTKVEPKHSKSKSGNHLKHISEQMRPQIQSKPQFISPTHLSTSGKLTHKYVNSISSHHDLLGHNQDSNNMMQFTIDNRKNHLKGKYDVAVNLLKSKSNFAKTEELLQKYSRDQTHKTKLNFTGSTQSKGSFKKYNKPLKVKKSQIHRVSESESAQMVNEFNSASKLKNSVNAVKKSHKTHQAVKSYDNGTKRRK